MFRQASHEGDSQQSHIKMQMLQSNIVRVISQNKRLQHLLEYRDYFPKLMQHCTQVSFNWAKLNTLIAGINELDVEIKTERENMHTNVNQHYEHINKNIVQKIKNYKQVIDSYQERVVDIKGREKLRIKKNYEKLKAKWSNYTIFAQSQLMDILIQAQNNFVKGINEEVIPQLAEKIENEFQINEVCCRIQLGHVQNLLSYYSSLNNKDKKSSEIYNQQISQNETQTIRLRTELVVDKNTKIMEEGMKQMQSKLKGVSSQISWLQSKRRKMKRMNTKQSQLSRSNNEELTENPKLLELKYQSSQIQCQLMGLGKYCDEMMLEKKIKEYILKKQKDKNGNSSLLSQNQQRKLLCIKQKLNEISSRIKQYDQFYKNFNV